MRKAPDIAALLAVAVSVLAMGGVQTGVAIAAAVLAAFAAGGSVSGLKRSSRRPLISLVGMGFMLATLLCVVQLIPLPAFVHSLLNPTEHDLWLRGASAAGLDASSARPLSMDPWETADRGIRYAALALISLWATNLRGRNRWRWVARWLVAIALCALVLGAGLHFSGTETFLGLYETSVKFRGPSPFVSTNHGAVYFGLAAIVAGAAAFAQRSTSAREASVLALAACAFLGAVVAHQSDGVNIALVLTISAAALFQWLRKGRQRSIPREAAAGAVLVGALSIALAVWLDLHQVLNTATTRVLFGGEHGGRLALMSAGIEASGDYWLFGAGAGAVSTVIPSVLDWSEVVPASVPLVENDVLELILSFGWPLGLLIVGAMVAQFALGTRRALGKRKNPRVAVATISAFYLGLIGQLHFPLFALGISLGAVAWLDVLWSRRSKSASDGRFFDTGHVAVERRTAMVLLAALVFTVGLFGAARATWLDDREFGATPTVAQLEREVWLRPGNHAPYVKLATAAVKAGDGDRALTLTELALSRENSPRLRLYQAQVLAELRLPDAKPAFAELLREGHHSRRVLDALAKAFDDESAYVEVLGDTTNVWDLAVRRLAAHRDKELVSSVVVGLVTAHPDEVEGYRVASRAYLAMKQPVLARMWAEHADDMERSTAVEERVAPLLIARSLRAAGDFEGAKAALSGLSDDPTVGREVHRQAVELRTSLGPDSLEFVRGHYQVLCTSPVPARDQVVCWRTEAWIADIEGDPQRALTLLRLVYRRHGQLAPLATYLSERGDCGELQRLTRQADGRQIDYLQRLIGRCSPR